MQRNERDKNGQVKMMDCNIGKAHWDVSKEKPTICVHVGGKKIRAIVDTGCAQTLIGADLAPQGWAPNAGTVKMICMHGQPSMYPRKKYVVEILDASREMPVVLAKDLPYPVISGRGWNEIYNILNTVRRQETKLEGLTGEEARFTPSPTDWIWRV